MEIIQAQVILQNLIKSKTDELQAAQLALDLLNNTFKADFTSLETAQKEANDGSAKVAELTTTVTNKDQEISTLTTTVKETQDKLDSAKEELSTAAETIATLQAAPVEPVEKLPPVQEGPTDQIITP